MAYTVGRKDDQEKLRTDLVPVSMVRAVAEVLTLGAAKYGDRNWEKGLEWNRPYGAALRHLFAWWDGETYDKESGLNHLAHVLCEIAFLVEYHNTHPELDNRPRSPKNLLYQECEPMFASVFDHDPEAANDGGLVVRTSVSRTGDGVRYAVQPVGVDSCPPNTPVRDAASVEPGSTEESPYLRYSYRHGSRTVREG